MYTPSPNHYPEADSDAVYVSLAGFLPTVGIVKDVTTYLAEAGHFGSLTCETATLLKLCLATAGTLT